MMRRLLLCLCLAAGVTAGASAQEMTMGQPEQMKMFEPMAGEFDVKMKVRMDPSMEWQESSGKTTFTMILNGCVQMQEMDAAMMGMPMKGVGMLTYNRSTGKYQQMWTDSFGQGISLYDGVMADGKLVHTGKDNMGGMEMHIRSTTYDMSADSFKWKMEVSQDGQNYMEMMLATYTRKSGGSSDSEDSGGW